MSPRVQNVFIQPQRQRQRRRGVSRPHTHTDGAHQHGHVAASMANALDFNKQPERPPACQLTWPLAVSLLAWFQFVLITQKINKKGSEQRNKTERETNTYSIFPLACQLGFFLLPDFELSGETLHEICLFTNAKLLRKQFLALLMLLQLLLLLLSNAGNYCTPWWLRPHRHVVVVADINIITVAACLCVNPVYIDVQCFLTKGALILCITD